MLLKNFVWREGFGPDRSAAAALPGVDELDGWWCEEAFLSLSAALLAVVLIRKKLRKRWLTCPPVEPLDLEDGMASSGLLMDRVNADGNWKLIIGN